MIVEIPGLVEVPCVEGDAVLLAPTLRLIQVVPVGLWDGNMKQFLEPLKGTSIHLEKGCLLESLRSTFEDGVEWLQHGQHSGNVLLAEVQPVFMFVTLLG